MSDQPTTAAPTRYYVAKKPGRLLGQLFCTDDVLKVSGQVDVNSAILREITEPEWRELVADNERRLVEMFPEAAKESVMTEPTIVPQHGPRSTEWGVLSEDGTIYSVGVWRAGFYYPGTLWRAWWEMRRLRRDEPGARLARKPIVWREEMVRRWWR